MAIRIGINGFGRIGRNTLRAAKQLGIKDLDFVAVNDLTDTKTLAHLLKYDSVHGRFAGDVKAEKDALVVDGDSMRVLAEKDPAKLPWKELVLPAVKLAEDGFAIDAHLSGSLNSLVATSSEFPELRRVLGKGGGAADWKTGDRLVQKDLARALRLIAEEERLMPYFHLSAQSGDDMILKRMKRRHARADTIAFCDTVRRHRPDAAFGADLIAGFPTETDAMFQNSLALVEDAGLSMLHVFSYSPRPGTPAAKMPPVPGTVIKERAARLRACGTAALTARLDGMIGSGQTILMERGGIGRTPCFTPVAMADIPHGAFLPVRITGRDGERLTAVPA